METDQAEPAVDRRTLSAAPYGRPGPDPGAAAAARAHRTPPRSAGTGRRGTVAASAVRIVVALAGFALAMSALVGPAADGATSGHAGHAGHAGPTAADFVAIEAAAAARRAPRPGPAASTGSFASRCGRNTDGHRNSDNFIVAPGVTNGAHHVHDYVGNTSTDGTSTDESLAAAATTCERGDKSVYFWPVLRDIRHAGEDADRPGGGRDGNLGHILTPTPGLRRLPRQPAGEGPARCPASCGSSPATPRPSPTGRRAQRPGGVDLLGHAGPGQHHRTTRCAPAGQLVQRIGEFPSCWNGAGTDSDDHRTHVTFPDPVTGACPTGTVAIPRLRITVSYRVPPGRSFAIDSFPDQQRKAVTDHFDFENLMPESLMGRAVDCINTGRTC